jgi:molybdate transport system substrate-binding protein
MRRTPLFVPCALLLTLLLAACGGGGATPTPSAGAARAAVTANIPVAPGTTAINATASPAAGPGAPTVAASPRVSGNLTVFAAASLTDAFTEMKRRIEAANPGTTIALNFAASSALETQLEQGAKADVFASADQPNLDKARKASLIAGDDRVFVRNTPVIIVPANNPKNIAGPKDLAGPGVKLVLTSKDVPIGNYARQILDNLSKDPAYGADFSQQVLANLISEEANVRQVVSKVQLGEGDAGIVYSSDVTPAVRNRVKTITIPDWFNVIAQYPAAVVKGAANEAGARAFLDYLLSPEGQSILAQWGFIPLEGPGARPAPGAVRPELIPSSGQHGVRA